MRRGELEIGSAADWVCAATRVVLVSTPLNRGTVLTTPLLSASLQRGWNIGWDGGVEGKGLRKRIERNGRRGTRGHNSEEREHGIG